MANFILIVLRIQKKYAKVQLPLCSNVYDDVTDFAICGFHKNTKINIYLENETRNNQLHIKDYFMAKNTFVVEVTFKVNMATCAITLCTK